MNKKILMAIGIALFFVELVFSQYNNTSPISIGVKATIDFSGDNDVQTGPLAIFVGHSSASRSITGTASDFQGGLSVFFDAKYVEFSTNFLFGGDFFQIEKVLGVDVNYNQDVSFNCSVGFSLLGKFPFSFGKFALAPALGIEYRIMVGRLGADFLDDNETVPNDYRSPYNSFLIKFGGIIDYELTDSLYLRGNILGCFTASLFTDGFPFKSGYGAQFQFGIGYRI